MPAAGLAAVAVAAHLVPLGNPAPPDPQIALGRATALLGLWGIFFATLSSADPALAGRLFGRSYRTVHYACAAFGLACLLVHPLTVALRLGTAAVFLPDLRSWRDFLAAGGRPAWYLLWIATALAFLGRRSRLSRLTHLLVYPAFGLAAAHALLIGRTHALPWLRVVTILMAVIVLVVPFWRVLQRRARRRVLRD